MKVLRNMRKAFMLLLNGLFWSFYNFRVSTFFTRKMWQKFENSMTENWERENWDYFPSQWIFTKKKTKPHENFSLFGLLLISFSFSTVHESPASVKNRWGRNDGRHADDKVKINFCVDSWRNLYSWIEQSRARNSRFKSEEKLPTFSKNK